MNEKALDNFKTSDTYKAAMTNLALIMDSLMQFAYNSDCTYEEAIEFTKKELNEFIEKFGEK